MNKLNIFSGKNSILDFLNPDKNNFLPLVEIPPHLNPYYKEGVRIYAKLLNMLPLLNVKSLPAISMLNKAKKDGRLKEVAKLIENSSGNTALSLSVLGRLMGIKITEAFVSHEISDRKLKLLRLFGVNVIVSEESICPDPADKNSGIYKAKKIGNKPGCFNAGQYENNFNPKSHKKWTAKQIWEQLDGDLQLFCSGLGTTGTMVGCSKFFNKQNKKIRTVGVIRSPNNPVPGVRTRNLLNIIAFNWRNYTDYIEEVGTKDSFKESLKLIRNGLVVGPSSGLAFAGLLKHLQSLKDQNKLGELKNNKSKINAVFICCDTPFVYLDDYFQYLNDSYFPKIKNKKLLTDKMNQKRKSIDDVYNFDILPVKAYSMIYNIDKNRLWEAIKKGIDINIKDNVLIIDIRDKKEFEHFHIFGSNNIKFDELLLKPKKYLKKMKKNKVIFVCNVGIKSISIAKIFKKLGIKAYSLYGGMVEWSNLGLPRWRKGSCFCQKNKNYGKNES